MKLKNIQAQNFQIVVYSASVFSAPVNNGRVNVRYGAHTSLKSDIANAAWQRPARALADYKVLRSPCRSHSLSTTISRLRMSGPFAPDAAIRDVERTLTSLKWHGLGGILIFQGLSHLRYSGASVKICPLSS
jgi:hypothetical protein